MRRKLQCVLIYIKFLLLFLTFAHAKEITSKFKGLPTKYNLLKRATFELEPNGELCTHYKTIFDIIILCLNVYFT